MQVVVDAQHQAEPVERLYGSVFAEKLKASALGVHLHDLFAVLAPQQHLIIAFQSGFADIAVERVIFIAVELILFLVDPAQVSGEVIGIHIAAGGFHPEGQLRKSVQPFRQAKHRLIGHIHGQKDFLIGFEALLEHEFLQLFRANAEMPQQKSGQSLGAGDLSAGEVEVLGGNVGGDGAVFAVVDLAPRGNDPADAHKVAFRDALVISPLHHLQAEECHHQNQQQHT